LTDAVAAVHEMHAGMPSENLGTDRIEKGK